MKINTTVTLDAELFNLAKANNIKVSKVCNDALRSHFETQGNIDTHVSIAKAKVADLEQELLSTKAFLVACENAKNAQTEQEKSAYLEKAREINKAEKAHGKNRWL